MFIFPRLLSGKSGTFDPDQLVNFFGPWICSRSINMKGRVAAFHLSGPGPMSCELRPFRRSAICLASRAVSESEGMLLDEKLRC